MMKRIMRAAISAVVCVALLPLNMFAVAEDTASPFSGGSGTEADPYQIATAYDLRLLSELTNDPDTSGSYYKCHYVQTADINLNNETFIPIGTRSEEYTGAGFSGTYDGNYYTIEGLYVERESMYNGLFGWVYGGTIENLSVYGEINCPNISHCGGIAGEIGDTSASLIKNCSFDGSVVGTYNTGGIVGYSWRSGRIEGCYFNGVVTTTSATAGNCGGIIGAMSNGSSQDSTFSGDSGVENCYSTGTLKCSAGTDCGGIIGKFATYGETSKYSIANNYYLNTMSVTGINGDVTTGCTKLASAALKACADMLGSPFVDNFETDNFNDGYPIFEWQSTPYQFKGSGTAEDPYQISNKDELKKMRDLVNSTYFTPTYGYAYYKQTANIDLENELWEPIGTRMVQGVDLNAPMFNGNYDGNYHTITNLYVNETDKFSGLFGCMTGSLAIENLVVYGKVTSTGPSTGGICGEICNGGGVVRNCAFIGDVTSASAATGGVVGYLWLNGTVENCYHNGEVSTGGNGGGGVVGYVTMGGSISKYLAIRNCYHVGSVTGNGGWIGDVVGYSENRNEVESEFVIDNCFCVKNDLINPANGSYTSCNITDVSASLLKKTAEELGSPFVTSPSDSLNNGYPVFAWQLDTWGKGDINLDGQISVADAVYLQGYLLGRFRISETEWHAADLIDDDNVDAFDMVIMRRILINGEVA